jgi:hypothetical protein
LHREIKGHRGNWRREGARPPPLLLVEPMQLRSFEEEEESERGYFKLLYLVRLLRRLEKECEIS